MKYGAAAARRDVIIERLRAEGFAATGALAQLVGVSEMTVRRDLQALQTEGALHLVHGGATVPIGARGASFDARQMINIEAKQRIGRHAASGIGSEDTIALDAGTTAHALAGALPARFTGCVVTPSVPVVQLLMGRDSARVIALGGDLHKPSRACVGPLTVEGAAQLSVKTFFLGAAAVDRRGIYVSADLERPTKLQLMSIADRIVLIADRSKFSVSAPVLLCPLARVRALITDAPPPRDVATALRAAGIAIEIAT